MQSNESAWFDGQSLTLDTGESATVLEFRVEHGSDEPVITCTVLDQSTQENDDQAHLFQAALLTAQHHVSQDGIVIVAPDGEILFSNQRYAEVWGIPDHVMETKSIFDVRKVTSAQVVEPDGIFLEGFQRYDNSREISQDELQLLDGRTLLRHSAPVLDAEGTVLGRFWSYRDLTDVRQARLEINRQSELLRALVDNNPDVVFMMDDHGYVESANEAIKDSLGYSAEEVRERELAFLTAEHDRARLAEQIEIAIHGRPAEAEVTMVRADEELAEFRLKLIPVSPGSEDRRYWVVGTDITEIQRASAEAARARAALERAQQIAHLGSFEWNNETGELVYSSELFTLFGMDKDDAADPTFYGFFEHIQPDDRQPLLELINEAVTAGTTYEMDIRAVHPDGERRILHILGEALTDDHGHPIRVAGAALDITDRKQQEEALQHLVSMLEEKTEALEQTTAEQESFIYSVSHDLRSPLISIQGIAEIIEADYQDQLDETARAYLGRILANVRRLQAMLTGLLELSRIGKTERGSRHDVDLHGLVTKIIDEINGTSPARNARIDVVDQLPVVQAHYSRMSQLFMNLLDNAIKYTPEDRTPHIVISCQEADNGWSISVKDNGVGIPAEHQSSAVGMFSRLSSGQRLNPSGSGLGLAIVSRIVTTHGGRLSLESSGEEGTTISFTLS